MQDQTFQKTSETVRDGFATPHKLSGVPGSLSGCIYRADGTKVALSERFGGYAGDHIKTQNPDAVGPPKNVKKIAGRGLYLGHYMGSHYGHFITETLSTFWIFEEKDASSFDYVLFHPFVFGESITDYAKVCFDRFGIAADKVMIAGTEMLAFDEIVVPERLFRLNHSSDPRLRWVYKHIAAGAQAIANAPQKLYLSRRQFTRGKLFRVVANEVQIEDAFRDRGFKVLYPETMTFEDQIALYSGAQCVAGISGSGLHNSLFMEPGSTVVELGDPRYGGERSPTQVLCDSISGVRNALIPFVGWKFAEYRVMLFDMTALRARLDTILPRDAATSRAFPPLRAQDRILQGFEIAYLSLRPIIGLMARSVLKHLRLAK